MKRPVSFAHIVPFLYTLVVAVSFIGCRGSEKFADDSSAKQPASTADSTESPDAGSPTVVNLTQAQYTTADIQLGQPESRTLGTMLKLTGVLDVPPQSRVSVSMPVGGYIRSIKLEPGAKVRKGQTLAVLENPEFIQLQQDYLDIKAQLEYADLEFARQQELSRENVNALKVLQKTRSDRQRLQAQLAGMGQRLSLLHINPATLRADHLIRTVGVPSPVNGYVTDVPVNNGRFVNPADVIIEVTDVGDLHVHLNVFEKDITHIRTGQAVRFGLGGAGAPMHQATIFMKGKSIDADRTVAVLARPLGVSDDFIPGAYVSAQVAVTSNPLSVLPDAAIVGFGGKSYVYLLESKSSQPVSYRFRQVEVKPGVAQNGYTAVNLPLPVDVKTPFVVKGAYSLLSQQNNSGEEE
ncbi:efflux RND transporter periplasmic adaptor subunit [Spirosoma spitsbergense]|uniref:efflux RND transporter periplasmic adaptor subunit n=1 Tax=Spirosoma spitsbergense TaxID=431554 RepID=UPI00036B4880|nr:efflux RND transporter periplasmic adaptor subunit [Spirosoma spitsbergense]